MTNPQPAAQEEQQWRVCDRCHASVDHLVGCSVGEECPVFQGKNAAELIAQLRADLAEAKARNPELGYGYYGAAGGLSQGDGESTQMLYKTDELQAKVWQLESALRDKTAAAEAYQAIAERRDDCTYSAVPCTLALQLSKEAEAGAKWKTLAMEASHLLNFEIMPRYSELYEHAFGVSKEDREPSVASELAAGWLEELDALVSEEGVSP